jgi:hypothetical protein
VVREAQERVSRINAEPADVWLHDGKPARFVWRGRLYAVLIVVEQPAAGAAEPGTGARKSARYELWRVEASPEKNVPAVVYELRRDIQTGRWLLSRPGG